MAKSVLERDKYARILVFDDRTSDLIELDFRGTQEDVLRRVNAMTMSEAKEEENVDQSADRRRPGRPKLGVVAREITLLPRHWDWLTDQPGGASVAIRKLVDEARRVNRVKDSVRAARESAYRFLFVMAGDEPGFEEAARALFAGNHDRFLDIIEQWPIDIGNHAKRLTANAFVQEY